MKTCKKGERNKNHSLPPKSLLNIITTEKPKFLLMSKLTNAKS